MGQGFSKMLSMINPDSLTRVDNRFTSLTGKASHDNFYHEELEDHVHNGTLPGKPGTAAGKTMNNFYHAQQMQETQKRPGSA